MWKLEDTLKSGGLEEEDIRYVAYTRARKELCLVSLLKGGSDGDGLSRQANYGSVERDTHIGEGTRVTDGCSNGNH